MDVIVQFIPLLMLQLAYAVVVWLVAGKRGVNKWLWTIGSLVPFLGVFVSAVFLILSFLSVLDRLNKLEGRA